MAPYTTSCGSSSIARMPSPRCMTRSARLPGTEPEPTCKDRRVVGPAPRASRHLPFTQTWLLSQIHTCRSKPLQKSHADSNDQVLPASRGLPVEWGGLGIWSQVNLSPVPVQPLICCVTLSESLNHSEPGSSSVDRGYLPTGCGSYHCFPFSITSD